VKTSGLHPKPTLDLKDLATGKLAPAKAKLDAFGQSSAVAKMFINDQASATLRRVRQQLDLLANRNFTTNLLVNLRQQGHIVLPNGGSFVPGIASGGVVKARKGGTLAVLGEGGQDEAVIPLGQATGSIRRFTASSAGSPAAAIGGGGNTYITINVTGTADDHGYAKAVIAALNKAAKSGVKLNKSILAA